jgi:hypothetical protein
MKVEDTLKYNLDKYSGYKKFKEADENLEIPEEISYLKEFIKTSEERKWLSSILVNCRDLDIVYKIIKVRFSRYTPGLDREGNKIIEILKDIWIMECL